MAELIGGLGALALWGLLFYWVRSWGFYGGAVTLFGALTFWNLTNEGWDRGWQLLVAGYFLWCLIGLIAVRMGRARRAKNREQGDLAS